MSQTFIFHNVAFVQKMKSIQCTSGFLVNVFYYLDVECTLLLFHLSHYILSFVLSNFTEYHTNRYSGSQVINTKSGVNSKKWVALRKFQKLEATLVKKENTQKSV